MTEHKAKLTSPFNVVFSDMSLYFGSVFIGILTLMTGCISSQMQYRKNLGKYQDRVWDKTQPEFTLILDYLKQHHSIAKAKLSGNEPEVLVVYSSLYHHGFTIVTFEKEKGAGHFFYADGSGLDVTMTLGDLCSSDKLELEGAKRQAEFNKKREAAALKKRYAEEVEAIKNPQKVYLEDIIGIKTKTEISNKMLDADIWPDKDISYGKVYEFYKPRKYKLGTIPGLKPITEDFSIESIVCDKDGLFRSVFMEARVPLVDVDRFVTLLLHTIQAKLHTSKTAISSLTGYNWKDFELADGRRISIVIDKRLSESKYSYLVSCLIIDVTEYYERNKQKMAELHKKKDAETNEKIKNESVRNAMDGAMSELFNRIKGELVIIKAENGVGSGFIARDGNQVYLYTNEHVIRGGKKPFVTDLKGNNILLGDFELAIGRDLVRFKVAETRTGLSLIRNEIELNIDVTVFGNSDGAEVITALGGKVIGIGPSLLEVSTKFVQGNSGSPVLTLDGKVIGIASFAVNQAEPENWLKKDSQFNGVRRFAYRLDNVQWKKVDWELYSTIINR